jgi:hypothetical protein
LSLLDFNGSLCQIILGGFGPYPTLAQYRLVGNARASFVDRQGVPRTGVVGLGP